MSDERPTPDSLALALEWVTKITTVALEMVLPALGGSYLDKRIGTSYWAIVGLVVGFVVGMWHLLQMTRSRPNGQSPRKSGNGESCDE